MLAKNVGIIIDSGDIQDFPPYVGYVEFSDFHFSQLNLGDKKHLTKEIFFSKLQDMFEELLVMWKLDDECFEADLEMLTWDTGDVEIEVEDVDDNIRGNIVYFHRGEKKEEKILDFILRHHEWYDVNGHKKDIYYNSRNGIKKLFDYKSILSKKEKIWKELKQTGHSKMKLSESRYHDYVDKYEFEYEIFIEVYEEKQ